MHKDILVFLPEHKEKAERIVDLFLEKTVRDNYTGILSICGISGTGKTEIAQFVHEKLYTLGISSFVMNLDKYYTVPVDERKIWRQDRGYAGHNEMNWTKINNEIKMYGGNDVRVLIVEGLYAGYVRNGITFYIDGNIESTDEFRLLRGKENEKDEFRQQVVALEYSDILKNSHNHDYRI